MMHIQMVQHHTQRDEAVWCAQLGADVPETVAVRISMSETVLDEFMQQISSIGLDAFCPRCVYDFLRSFADTNYKAIIDPIHNWRWDDYVPQDVRNLAVRNYARM